MLRELVTALAGAGALPVSAVDEVVASLVKREQNGSTGFGKGVAVPHVKHPKVKKMAGTIGRSEHGGIFRGAGSSAGVHRGATALAGMKDDAKRQRAAAPAGHEHNFQQSSEGHVPPLPPAELDTRGDRRSARRSGSRK